LNFSKHGCNGGEDEKPYLALRIIYVFIHVCETFLLQGEWEKFASLSLVYDSMGHKERNRWN
jgi:hypothetical protein